MKSIFLVLTVLFTFTSLKGQNEGCKIRDGITCDTTKQSPKTKQDHSHVVFEGQVISIDTVTINDLLMPGWTDLILRDTGQLAECCRYLLKNTKVLKVKIQLTEVFKGPIYQDQKEIYVLTILDDKWLGYKDFELSKKFIVYAFREKRLDYTFFEEHHERRYFNLPEKYFYWTNRCKGTRLSNESELKGLREIDD